MNSFFSIQETTVLNNENGIYLYDKINTKMFKGVLNKMRSEISDSVTYFLDMNNEFLISNSILNKHLTIDFKGFSCLSCNSDQEIFRQGHCKKCFFESPSTAEWIIRPELSKAHLGFRIET